MRQPTKQHAAVAGDPGGGRIMYLNPVPDGYDWSCDECRFHRTFATVQGARQKITEHRLLQHNVQTFWG